MFENLEKFKRSIKEKDKEINIIKDLVDKCYKTITCDTKSEILTHYINHGCNIFTTRVLLHKELNEEEINIVKWELNKKLKGKGIFIKGLCNKKVLWYKEDVLHVDNYIYIDIGFIPEEIEKIKNTNIFKKFINYTKEIM